METKGLHLSGNPDTQYKEDLFDTLETAKPKAVEYGSLSLKSSKKKKHRMSLAMVFEDSYKEKFEGLVGG